MDINKILLDNITALISLNGLTETQCLTACNIHRNFLSNLRAGTLKHPCFEHVYALAQYFRISVDSLTEQGRYVVGMNHYETQNYQEEAQTLIRQCMQLDKEGRRIVKDTVSRECRRVQDSVKFRY